MDDSRRAGLTVLGSGQKGGGSYTWFLPLCSFLKFGCFKGMSVEWCLQRKPDGTSQASTHHQGWLSVGVRPQRPPTGCFVGASVWGMNDTHTQGLTRWAWEDTSYNLASVRWGDTPRKDW